MMTNAESECRRIIGRTLTGKARTNAYKDRVAETDQVKERKRARVEREAGDVPMEPGNKDDEQMAVRLRMHLAETSQKTSTTRTE